MLQNDSPPDGLSTVVVACHDVEDFALSQLRLKESGVINLTVEGSTLQGRARISALLTPLKLKELVKKVGLRLMETESEPQMV